MAKKMKKEAKMMAVKELKDLMSGLMKDKMGDAMQKVTVMAKDPEGLQEGLEKAQELTGEMGAMSDEDMNDYGEDDKKAKLMEMLKKKMK